MQFLMIDFYQNVRIEPRARGSLRFDRRSLNLQGGSLGGAEGPASIWNLSRARRDALNAFRGFSFLAWQLSFLALMANIYSDGCELRMALSQNAITG